MVKLLYGAIFAFGGIVIVVAMEGLLLAAMSAMSPYGTTVMPRGLGWIAMPIAAALARLALRLDIRP